MFQVDNSYDFPRDVIGKEVLCQMIGQKEFIIENYKRLLLFLPEEIKVQCHCYTLTIKGEHLVISYYNNETIILSGCIHEISFL
ncbi:MAG: YabP/YqfC family sporulation protein [Eubacterium sp.]|nr:YabP/YqfC family sporulation protein [Eubacterium sp.]